MPPILLQVKLGSLAQFQLFCRGYAFQAAAEGVIFTKTYFDKNQHFFIEHDDINLTMAAAEVFID